MEQHRPPRYINPDLVSTVRMLSYALQQLLDAVDIDAEKSAFKVSIDGDEAAAVTFADLLRSASEVVEAADVDLIAAGPDLRTALVGMLAEWDKFTRYGSPIAKASNERVSAARAALAKAGVR